MNFLVWILFWWWGVQRGDVGGEKMVTIGHICYTSLHTPVVSTYIWTVESLFPKYLQEMFRNRRSVRINFFFSIFFRSTSQRRSCSGSNGATIQLMGRSHAKHIIGAKCIIMYVQYGNMRLWCVISGTITIL